MAAGLRGVRKLAAHKMAQEAPGQTLQPTALVHEAWLRLGAEVEAGTNLANHTWPPVGTNTLSGGSSYFSDSQWTNYSRRFYRLRWP